MKLRQAVKVRNRAKAGEQYRETTLRRARNRLAQACMPSDLEYWFIDLLKLWEASDPFGFAAKQFERRMELAAMKDARWKREAVKQ